MGDGDKSPLPPWTDRLQALLLPAMRDRLDQAGVEGSGAYNYYESRVGKGQVFLEYEIELARKLLSCGLDIRRIDEIGSGFGQLMFLLGWNGFRTVGFEANRLRDRTAGLLRGMLARVEPALTGNVRLIRAEFPSFAAPRPGPGAMVLTTNLVSSASRPRQLAVLKAMRRYPFVLSDVQRFFDYRSEPDQEPEALALFAEAGLGDPQLFLDLGRGGRYFLFANPDPPRSVLSAAFGSLWPKRANAGRRRLRVFALGSCRVHDPLTAAHRAGEVDYLNRRIRSRNPIYLHDIHEMIQFLRLLAGDVSMPSGIAPFAFHDWQPAPARLGDPERLVIEVCTDKHYEAMGHSLNVNEIHRQIVAPAGAAGEAWWQDVHRGEKPPAGVIDRVEEALRSVGRLTEVHSRMLREIAFVPLSAEAIAEGMARLQRLVPCPILVMPHVAVRLADGSPLAERMAHIDKTIAAARQAGLAVLDPRSFVDRDGQPRALGLDPDSHHYAEDYLPVVGREIAKSLRLGAP